MKVHMYKKEIINICLYNHLTVDEIFEKIKVLYPKIGRSTVYRNVEEMSNKWELVKLNINWWKNIYEANIWKHCHFLCKKTWKIFDINVKNIEFDIPEWWEVNNVEVNLYWNVK